MRQVKLDPFIIGELACGNLKNGGELLPRLQILPVATRAEHREVAHFIENYRLVGKGLGSVDMHMLASALLSQVPLWTLDKKLNQVSAKMGVMH